MLNSCALEDNGVAIRGNSDVTKMCISALLRTSTIVPAILKSMTEVHGVEPEMNKKHICISQC